MAGQARQSLDETIFPGKHILSKSLFLQRYCNWLLVLDIVANLRLLSAGRMNIILRCYMTKKISASFKAWRSMDKQLCTQVSSRIPFIVDPSCNMYTHFLSMLWMDIFPCSKRKNVSFQGGIHHPFGVDTPHTGGRRINQAQVRAHHCNTTCTIKSLIDTAMMITLGA